MQRAEDPSSRVAAGPTRGGLRPATAFLLLSALVGVVTAIVLLTRPAAAPPPATTKTSTEPNFALTNEEAIARFEHLHSRELKAYASADPSMLEGLFTPQSPVAPTVRREVRRLVRDRVVALTTYDTRSLSVVANTPSEIHLRQVAIVTARFMDSSGRDITRTAPVQKQTIQWTLQLVESDWRLHDAVIKESKVLK